MTHAGGRARGFPIGNQLQDTHDWGLEMQQMPVALISERRQICLAQDLLVLRCSNWQRSAPISVLFRRETAAAQTALCLGTSTGCNKCVLAISTECVQRV